MAIRIPHEPVEGSSLLTGYGYEAGMKILAVHFANGHIRHYAGVPLETVLEFQLADSKGKFYNSDIKGRYESALMTGPCNLCAAIGWPGDVCRDCGGTFTKGDR